MSSSYTVDWIGLLIMLGLAVFQAPLVSSLYLVLYVGKIFDYILFFTF